MIRSTGLQFHYPQGPLLQFPDMEVAQGSVLLLNGPSGCGKSTWLALAAALVAPSAGELVVAGQALQEMRGAAADAWRARTLGFLPQRLHLSEALSVYQNLAIAQWASGRVEDRAAIDTALQALGVLDLAHRRPTQLSGGQAQRVALARAVLLQPQVLLADEPTASLDDEAAADAVQLLLQTAARQRATLVVATHDARVAKLIPTDAQGQPSYTALRLVRPAIAGGAA